MTREQMIRQLDQAEAALRSVEASVNRVRAALRDEIDPQHRRRDLGYWPDEEPEGLRLRPRVGSFL
jgi:hypothetical protein